MSEFLPQTGEGTLGWSIEQFLQSNEWLGRSPITRKNQRFVLDHLKLREALEAIPAEKRIGPIILNQYGNGYEPNGLSSAFREAFKRTGIGGFTPHGLRVNAAEAFAEAGCTPHQIMAITGHKTLAMVEHYTRKADQQKRARDAMRKWERSERGTERETGATGNKRHLKVAPTH